LALIALTNAGVERSFKMLLIWLFSFALSLGHWRITLIIPLCFSEFQHQFGSGHSTLEHIVSGFNPFVNTQKEGST
jgi:hypothetical protein